MDRARFRRLCAGVERLSVAQLRELRARLRGLQARVEVRARIDARRETVDHCVHCGATTLQRWGATGTGMRRWRCKACRRTFSSTTGTALERLRRPEAFHEVQVPWSNALQARGSDGLPYLLGPAARLVLDHEQLHPLAREALDASGALESIRRNPYRSIVARGIELVQAAADAIDIVEAYQPAEAAAVPWQSRSGVAAWATEAPRGLLFHRYEVGEDGLVAAATIVPPTSQNQAAIEADIAAFAPRVLDLPMDPATHTLEQLIRAYDPCISCATHFLDLTVDQAAG